MKKTVCIILAVLLLMGNFSALASDFNAFTVENPFTGMSGATFRFVIAERLLPNSDISVYKNKKVEGVLLLNGEEIPFTSTVSDVEPRDGGCVLVVPQTAEVKADQLKAYQDAGGKFNITVFPDEGEMPDSYIAFDKLPDFGNIFEPYLTKTAPEILKTLSETTVDGVKQTEIQFASYDGKNKIYAKIFCPEKEGIYPGIVLYHGGDGSAASHGELAQFLAKEGYAVITPDLPGIGNPEKMSNTEGDFKSRGYNQQAQIGMDTDPKNSTIFQGIIAAIDSVYLLKSLDFVDSSKIGISGNSWGGFTTTKIAGLLGDDISCAYSVYGCAYYDSGTHWSKNVFPNFGETNEKLWMTYLDASATISGITCPYFIEAPTNDSYYFPTAVDKTIKNIKAPTNKVFTANTNHVTHPDNFTQRLGFFNHHLKNAGPDILEVTDIAFGEEEDLGLPVEFSVPSDRKTEARVYFADADLDWSDKKWSSVSAKVENGKATALIPAHLLFENTILYGYASDENKFYASTDMLTASNLNPRELTAEELLNFIEPTTIINESDKECTQNGSWISSSLVGYEGRSIYSNSIDASVTYTPLLKAGKYKVSAFVIVHERIQSELSATVNSALGETETKISTNIPQSGWVEIGEYEFKSGTDGSVTLKGGDETAGDANPVRLDAVRFELIEDAPEGISVFLNGNMLKFPQDQLPLIVESRTLVAFRSIFEALGLTVSWDQETRTASGTKDGMEISLPIGSNTAKINGVEKTTDVPAQIINERTYVPLRFLSEALGFTVTWDGDTQTVTITE